MKHVVIAFILLCVLSIGGCKSSGNPEAEKVAVQAAQDWLALVDAGQYAQSWDEVAEYFKNAVAQDKWIEMVWGVRNPLGAMKTREVKSSRYTTSVPGAPDGEYVIIQFNTSFENKQSAVETVTPMSQKDGNWGVSGYYIK